MGIALWVGVCVLVMVGGYPELGAVGLMVLAGCAARAAVPPRHDLDGDDRSPSPTLV